LEVELAFLLPIRHICQMVSTKPNRFDAPAFSYRETEDALARTLQFNLVAQRGMLRARLKHLQRLGLIELNLGKQKRAQYSRAQVTLWLLALVLADAGLDPALIVAALKNNWRRLASTLELATSDEATSGRPYFLHLTLRVMSASVVQKPALTIGLVQLQHPNPYAPISEQLRELRALVAGEFSDWSSLFNVTRILSRLQNYLPRKD
jgi:hypothetical protein